MIQPTRKEDEEKKQAPDKVKSAVRPILTVLPKEHSLPRSASSVDRSTTSVGNPIRSWNLAQNLALFAGKSLKELMPSELVPRSSSSS